MWISEAPRNASHRGVQGNIPKTGEEEKGDSSLLSGLSTLEILGLTPGMLAFLTSTEFTLVTLGNDECDQEQQAGVWVMPALGGGRRRGNEMV